MSSCNDGFYIPWGRGGRIAPAWQQYTTLPSQSLTWMAEGKREDDLSWVSDWWISSYCSFFDTWWLEGKEGGAFKTLWKGFEGENSIPTLQIRSRKKKRDILPILCNKILAMSNFVSWVWNPNAEPIMTRNLRRARERSLHSATPPANPLSPFVAPRAVFSRSQTERGWGEGKWFAGVEGRRGEEQHRVVFWKRRRRRTRV